MQGLFQPQESCPGSVEHLQIWIWSGTTKEMKDEGEPTICVHKSPPGSFPWKFNPGLVVPYLPAPSFPLPCEGAAPGLVGNCLFRTEFTPLFADLNYQSCQRVTLKW